jgi:hypothetical protein
MSFDIFLQCFRDGEVATFDRAAFEQIFGAVAVSRRNEEGFVRMEFADGGGADIYIGDEDALDCVMFNHCGGDVFFDALYELADRIKGLIYWPGAAPIPSSVITEATTLRHIPEEFVKGCGPPIVVKNGEEITEAIVNS